jgi:hypothetical protein
MSSRASGRRIGRRVGRVDDAGLDPVVPHRPDAGRKPLDLALEFPVAGNVRRGEVREDAIHPDPGQASE